MSFFTPYQIYCASLKEKNLERFLPCEKNRQNFDVFCKTEELERESLNFDSFIAPTCLDFSQNDYLNLSRHPLLLEAAYQAGLKFGLGSTGSRLLSGDSPLFQKLESQIAADKKTEAALIFNSGYQANLSVLATLTEAEILGQPALVFFDKLNHASLYQGIFLSQAKCIRYIHHDLDHLKSLLNKYRDDPRPKFIVCETVHGMEGDLLPLQDIVSLARQFQAFLYLDEAHATGLVGPKGYGLSTTIDLSGLPHLIMGTFSKGLGVCGAYIACSALLKHYLINRCPGFKYSTSLSPMIMGAVAKGWDLLPSFSQKRLSLFHKANDLRKALQKLGYSTGSSCTPIVPILLQDELKALQYGKILAHHSIQVSVIRPPTVPPGTSRLRLTLTINHKSEDINYFIDKLTAL